MTAHDLVQIEKRNYFFNWNFFAVVFRRPTEQAKVIAHRRWQISALDIIVHAGAFIAFAHFRAVLIQDERDVRKTGRRGAERPIQLNVLGRV